MVAADALGEELNLIGSADFCYTEKTDYNRLQIHRRTYRFRIDGDLPLDRKVERNAYREALITLEQRQREYENAEDEVKFDVRQAYRDLQEAAERYRIQKNSLELAEKRVESTSLLLEAGRAITRDLLESHDDLKKAYLPPGQSWAPQRRGGGSLWQRTRFTVANRTVPLKTPTLWSVGVGGKLLSLDADLIIVDDCADPDDSYNPSGRDKLANWFRVKLATRKMMHTALIVIGSRVHPLDLYSELLDTSNWDNIVNQSHNQTICGLDLWENHTKLADPEACVLFPEINPLRYLRDQYETVEGPLFEMIYQNAPHPEGAVIFDVDKIRDNCFDRSRNVGLEEIAGTFRLVAGLDPAARGTQAAFLWAVQLPKDGNPRDSGNKPQLLTYYMVDLETQQAGGAEGAHRIMEEWLDKYGVTQWVIEDNAYQSVFFTDPRTRQLVTELGLEIKPVTTGQNKHDPDFGVAGMAVDYHNGTINLPYGNIEARRKTDMLVKELASFTGDTVSQQRRKAKSDILMSSWFPFATIIRKWKREARHQNVEQRAGASFPEYASPTLNDVPWGGASYPER